MISRNSKKAWLGGVLAGLAEVTSTPVMIWRAVIILAFVFLDVWIVAAYVMAVIMLPDQDGQCNIKNIQEDINELIRKIKEGK